MMNTTRRFLRGAGITATLALTLGLAACGGDDSSDAGGSGDTDVTAADLDAALTSSDKVTLEYWTWVPGIEPVVDLFEAKYPNITVNVTNAGQSADQYTKLQNAVKAGTGAPDVAQIEYFALPQFALSEAVVNLSDIGLDLESEYTGSAWDQVTVSGSQYGFPQDTGPMVMFYRADILERLGVEVPTTWEEFTEVARAIKADNPANFITSIDPGDAGGVDSLIWQAGGRPFSVDGTSVGVDFTDEGTAQWTELYDTLIQENLVDVAPGWNDAFWRSFAEDKYAMWLTGAWAPGSIRSNIPTTEGQWRAAAMPTYEAGTPMNAENGGSGVSVLEQGKNKAAALAFSRWLTTDPEAVLAQSEAGLFPATTEIMADADFLATEDPFFGNQKTNEVFVESSKSVSSGWQYLPFQVYSNSIFGDTAGQALSNKTALADGLATWQESIISYGSGQGFTVK